MKVIPLEKGVWMQLHGYMTPGGDPVWVCPKCGQSEHVYGIEHPQNYKNFCIHCMQQNRYPWEKDKDDTQN